MLREPPRLPIWLGLIDRELAVATEENAAAKDNTARPLNCLMNADPQARAGTPSLIRAFIGRASPTRFGRPRKMTPHQRQEALQRLAAGETQADVARTYAFDAATISRLAAASPFEQGAVGDLR